MAVPSNEAAARDAQVLRTLTRMLAISGYFWMFAGAIGVLRLVGILVGEVPVSGPEEMGAAAAMSVGLVKGSVELKGRSALRRPGAAVTPGLRAFARIWLPAFALAAVHLAYMAVALAVLIAGALVGVFGTIFTLGLGSRSAWDNSLWNLSRTLWGVLEGELAVFEALAQEPVGAAVLFVVVGAFLFGPTVAAILVLRRGAA